MSVSITSNKKKNQLATPKERNTEAESRLQTSVRLEIVHSFDATRASYLFEHEVAVLVRAAFNSKNLGNVIWDCEEGFFVLNLISVLQLQSADLLSHTVVLGNVHLVHPCRQKRQ